MKRMSG
jgi:hypothetical protein